MTILSPTNVIQPVRSTATQNASSPPATDATRRGVARIVPSEELSAAHDHS
jgi:hypothetical protein